MTPALRDAASVGCRHCLDQKRVLGVAALVTLVRNDIVPHGYAVVCAVCRRVLYEQNRERKAEVRHEAEEVGDG